MLLPTFCDAVVDKDQNRRVVEKGNTLTTMAG